MKPILFLSVLIVMTIVHPSCKKEEAIIKAAKPVAASNSDNIFKVSSVLPVADYSGSVIANASYGCGGQAPHDENIADGAFLFSVTNEGDSLHFQSRTLIYFKGFGRAI